MDFTAYNSARATANEKAAAAQTASGLSDSAKQALADAQGAVTSADSAKAQAFSEWEAALKAEYAEAVNLGIDPRP